MDDLKNSIAIAGAGIKAQSTRMRVIAENVANADSIATRPGEDPYRRKTVSFKNVLDKHMGVETVQVEKIGRDTSEFPRVYDPGSPVADSEGYVAKSNVNRTIETMDLKEAQRAYEANLSVIDISKAMLNRTLELLR